MNLYGLCKEYGYCLPTCGLCADVEMPTRRKTLSWGLVRSIRASNMTVRETAQLMGISQRLVTEVRANKIWQELTEAPR